MEKVHKNAIEFEVKSMADGEVQKGIIEGYAAHFGNVDRQGDILVKGSLQAKEVRVPMFWNHNDNIVVGSAVVWEDAKGFRYRGEFALNSESEDVRRDAMKAYALAKDGHVTKNSFGYIVHDKEYKHIKGYDRPVRMLKKVEIFEISLVPVPSNNMAEVTSVKNYEPETEEQKAASGSTSLPLADRGREWDADAAVARVREWAGGPDKENIDWSKYRQAFFWYDANNPEDFGSYKLPFADVINGRLVAVPRGIFAAAAAMQGARGGVNIPESDRAAVRSRIASYYRKMGERPPWSGEGKSAEPLIDRKLKRLIRSGYLWV